MHAQGVYIFRDYWYSRVKNDTMMVFARLDLLETVESKSTFGHAVRVLSSDPVECNRLIVLSTR